MTNEKEEYEEPRISIEGLNIPGLYVGDSEFEHAQYTHMLHVWLSQEHVKVFVGTLESVQKKLDDEFPDKSNCIFEFKEFRLISYDNYKD